VPQPAAAKSAKRITAAEAAALVRPGDWLDYGSSIGQPDAFDTALAARAHELSGVKIRSTLTVRPRAVLEADPEGKHFQWYSWHFSGYDRKKHDAGISHYIPLNLGEVPDYYVRFLDPIQITVIKTCPMDANGVFNFGPTNLWNGAAARRADIVIAEVCNGLPFVHGPQNGLHASEVDYVIDSTHLAPAELPVAPATDADRAVGRLIAAEVENGACLQIGIGGMPNAVCSLLLDSPVRGLGIHTEMLTDGLVDLYKAGRVTGDAKTLDKGKITFTFALGTKTMYDAINRNMDFLCCPVDYTNLPHNIMRNERVVSINNTTQIDLQGQCASESDGHRHLTGTGGQLQFVRGAYASSGGKSFICLSSAYEKRGVRKSRIVLEQTPGNIVTTPRSDVMYVVTEHGLVNLKGKSIAERAKALISIAHPEFREGLERQAREHGLIPKCFA
jgi:acyl-CoA hydrolase